MRKVGRLVAMWLGFPPRPLAEGSPGGLGGLTSGLTLGAQGLAHGEGAVNLGDVKVFLKIVVKYP